MVRASARALRCVTVRDVMRMQMVTVVPEMTVRELAHVLLDAGIRSAPVLDAAGKIVGLASQSDVIAPRATRPRADGMDADCASPSCACGLAELRVRDVMGPVGPTVSPDEPLPRLVRRFVRERVQRALVVENGMLLGIVTPIDVLGAIDEAA
ncbi:MAG TPA: CBS domain-containing protein [Longimicrobium sp.]|uniref:CBS domain-containing protein n=1 Tax=Longimicrobium sp. TaxID=2029185 RepID=UPI002ED8B453